MRSEIRFFMTAVDESEFVRSLADLGASINEDRIVHHDIGDVHLQFLRCRMTADTLNEGRVALATSGFDLEQRYPAQHREAAEHLFRQIRSRIKRSFGNDVVRWHNPNLPTSPTNPSKTDKSCWVGPDALRWWTSSATHVIQPMTGGFVVAYRGT